MNMNTPIMTQDQAIQVLSTIDANTTEIFVGLIEEQSNIPEWTDVEQQIWNRMVLTVQEGRATEMLRDHVDPSALAPFS